jgi:hypothetical protein
MSTFLSVNVHFNHNKCGFFMFKYMFLRIRLRVDSFLTVSNCSLAIYYDEDGNASFAGHFVNFVES